MARQLRSQTSVCETVAEFLLETDALMRLRLVYKLFFIVYAAHIVTLVELSIIISQLQAFQKLDWRVDS